MFGQSLVFAAILATASLGIPPPGGGSPLEMPSDVRQETFAGYVLLHDLLGAPGGVAMTDLAFYPHAAERTVVKIETIVPYDNRIVGVERWWISHGGDERVSYLVRLKPDGRGGTDFSVSRDPAAIAKGELISPLRAIRALSAGGRRLLPGVFALHIRSTTGAEGVLYLNSEEDAHSPNNVSIAVPETAVPALDQLFGGTDGSGTVNCYLLAVGQARPVAGDDAVQIRIAITSAQQLRLIARLRGKHP